MPRPSPLGIEGTGLSFRDRDKQGRLRTAMARAKDENGAWQVKRFPVTSWHRDGTPVLPESAKDWARATRKAFVKEEAVAVAATFQDFAALLAENLLAAGIAEERVAIIRAVARALAAEGITDMRRDTFAARVQAWLRDLKAGWSMADDAPNRRTNPGPLSPASRNKLLGMCRQVTGLAVRKRRLTHDPLAELKRFTQETTFKPLFTVTELRGMVSDEARNHAATELDRLEAAIASHGGKRDAAIRAIAQECDCHWSSIYNALARTPEPDPWWLACCLLVYTGCRAQEAMHLRWDWIRWDARIITLKLADDYDSKTKTERNIPLEPELAAILNPLMKPAGHILPPEVRVGGSGVKKHAKAKNGKGARDYTEALRKYLHRIGMDAKDRTAHSLRHCYITMKIARADTNVDRLRKAVGHESFETTMGYGRQSQFYEAEVDQWPDSTLWLRRPLPEITTTLAAR